MKHIVSDQIEFINNHLVLSCENKGWFSCTHKRYTTLGNKYEVSGQLVWYEYPSFKQVGPFESVNDSLNNMVTKLQFEGKIKVSLK